MLVKSLPSLLWWLTFVGNHIQGCNLLFIRPPGTILFLSLATFRFLFYYGRRLETFRINHGGRGQCNASTARELCRKVGIRRNQTSLGCSKFNLNLNIFNCSSPGKFILWIVLKSAPLVALIHLEPCACAASK